MDTSIPAPERGFEAFLGPQAIPRPAWRKPEGCREIRLLCTRIRIERGDENSVLTTGQRDCRVRTYAGCRNIRLAIRPG
jgi:phage-related protein